MSDKVTVPLGAPLGALTEGTPVNVMSQLAGCWVTGFEIAAPMVDDGELVGYRVRVARTRTVLRGWVPLNAVLPIRLMSA
jgi:hypothetical protein